MSKSYKFTFGEFIVNEKSLPGVDSGTVGVVVQVSPDQSEGHIAWPTRSSQLPPFFPFMSEKNDIWHIRGVFTYALERLLVDAITKKSRTFHLGHLTDTYKQKLTTTYHKRY